MQVPAAVAAAQEAAEQQPLAKWATRPDGGMELQTGHAVKHLAWHARGDYFASVAPTGNTQVSLTSLVAARGWGWGLGGGWVGGAFVLEALGVVRPQATHKSV